MWVSNNSKQTWGWIRKMSHMCSWLCWLQSPCLALVVNLDPRLHANIYIFIRDRNKEASWTVSPLPSLTLLSFWKSSFWEQPEYWEEHTISRQGCVQVFGQWDSRALPVKSKWNVYVVSSSKCIDLWQALTLGVGIDKFCSLYFISCVKKNVQKECSKDNEFKSIREVGSWASNVCECDYERYYFQFKGTVLKKIKVAFIVLKRSKTSTFQLLVCNLSIMVKNTSAFPHILVLLPSTTWFLLFHSR